METLTIVEDLDVLEDGLAGSSPGREWLAVDQLGLESREEALIDGVVPALAGPAERPHEAVAGEELAEGGGGLVRRFRVKGYGRPAPTV